MPWVSGTNPVPTLSAGACVSYKGQCYTANAECTFFNQQCTPDLQTTDPSLTWCLTQPGYTLVDGC